MTSRRRDVVDAPTQPLVLPGGFATHEVRSVAEAVVTAMAQAQADSPPPRFVGSPRFRMLMLLIVVAAITVAGSIAIALQLDDHDSATARALATHATSGDCLTWPSGEPDRPAAVDCRGDHLFEVADAVEIDTLTDASGADPAAHLDRVFRDVCPAAVNRYLGSRFDPEGKFGVGMVWSPAGPQPQSGGLLLCGLQLSHPGASSTFQGRVRDLDQSAIWPAGTCLGILDGKATDVPVDCAAPHSMEITGAVSLADVFTGPPPAIAAQDDVVRDGCAATTAAYLPPDSAAATSLTVRYTPISAASWAAGSRQVACRLGSAEPGGRWAILVGSARTGLLIDGQPAAPAPAPPTADVATAPAASSVETPQEQEPADAADEPEPEAPVEEPGPVESADEFAPDG
ncbi:septum formation family protein [Mycobacterium sp. AZCC_0083]|uniref:septum formation family protein n=1 Tax=Mycobacterium sp. AZCC_0083 TaxID=2735882 RepID=UPI001619D99D|nr:septum formation family protein [Mycobacterium sp. AZCC_0083]MBB5166530.1 putative heme/steroid binding protein [Mycobacterium sp. AZCC_0083]